MNEARRWYQFSLTALFVLTFGIAILAGYAARREAERERQRVEFEPVGVLIPTTPGEDR